MTTALKPKVMGMTTAARLARRRAANPGSRGALSVNGGRRAGMSVDAVTVSLALMALLYQLWPAPDAAR